MRAWDVIGYAYDADIHCPDCAADRFGAALDDDRNPPEDSEGNPVSPIFATHENGPRGESCGDCGEYLAGCERRCTLDAHEITSANPLHEDGISCHSCRDGAECAECGEPDHSGGVYVLDARARRDISNEMYTGGAVRFVCRTCRSHAFEELSRFESHVGPANVGCARAQVVALYGPQPEV